MSAHGRVVRGALVLLTPVVVCLLATATAAQARAPWRTVATSVGAFNSVSCSGPSFCAAVGWSTGTDYSVTFNGREWSTAQKVTQYKGELVSVSCPVRGWCAAVTDLVAVTFYQDGHWSKLMSLGQAAGPPYPGTVAAISCTSRHFCAVVDGQGTAATFNGHRWSKPQLIDPDFPLNSLSCGASADCQAVDGGGRAFALHGSQWSGPQAAGTAALTAVACANTVFCEATDVVGHALVYEDGRWATVGQVDDMGATPLPLSCPGAGRCIAADGDGAFFVLANGRWGHHQLIDSPSASSGGIVSVSCPAGRSGFCALVDGAGNALTSSHAY